MRKSSGFPSEDACSCIKEKLIKMGPWLRSPDAYELSKNMHKVKAKIMYKGVNVPPCS